MIQAPQDFNLALGAEPGDIARLVKSRARLAGERIANEFFRGQFRRDYDIRVPSPGRRCAVLR